MSLDIFATSFELIQELSLLVDTPEPLSIVLSFILKDKICLCKRSSMSIPLSIVLPENNGVLAVQTLIPKIRPLEYSICGNENCNISEDRMKISTSLFLNTRL